MKISNDTIVNMLNTITETTAKLNNDWVTRELDWNTATNQEITEAINELPWSWWKESKYSRPAYLMELADIFICWSCAHIARANGDTAALANSIKDCLSLTPRVPPQVKGFKKQIAALNEMYNWANQPIVSLEPLLKVLDMSGFTIYQLLTFVHVKEQLLDFRVEHMYGRPAYAGLWNGEKDSELVAAHCYNVLYGGSDAIPAEHKVWAAPDVNWVESTLGLLD